MTLLGQVCKYELLTDNSGGAIHRNLIQSNTEHKEEVWM